VDRSFLWLLPNLEQYIHGKCFVLVILTVLDVTLSATGISVTLPSLF